MSEPHIEHTEPFPAETESAAREVFATVVDASRGGAQRVRAISGAAIDRLLDRIAATVVNDPADVFDADDTIRRIEDVTNNIGNTATVIGAPWLVNQALRFVRKGKFVPSTALITATATTLAAMTAGVSHLRLLASLLVHRLRAGGHRVDPMFVRRVAVALYLHPGRGEAAVEPNSTAAMRLAFDWGTRAVPLLGSRKTSSRVQRAAKAIEQLDLDAALAQFERGRAIDLRATTPEG
jgi:hypothetical protein